MWCDKCVEFGPAIGYYPKASKSWLIVKENKLAENKLPSIRRAQ
jgi:hypothetical protein